MGVVTTICVPLLDGAERVAADVGSKARNLAELKRAGFAVPDGFVITTAAFTRFIEVNGFTVDTDPHDARSGHLPDEVAAALSSFLSQLGMPVAVRSSGVAEDLAAASYAGHYETVLNVVDIAGAVTAVIRCWASAFDDHVVRYHAQHGGRGIPPMAVVVQQMVPAEWAGVAFSANPVTGDRDEVVINAIGGLADRLVAGEVNGQHWSVRGGTAVRVDGPGVGGAGAFGSARASRIARDARAVEAHFGAPQDVEWAIVGSSTWLLQARPITDLPPEPREVQRDIPSGYWEREVSHVPSPLTPFTASFWYDQTTDGLRAALAEFGILLETIEFRSIGGWAYSRFVPLGGKDRAGPPPWLMPALIRLLPSLRSRIRTSVKASRSDRAMATIDRWNDVWCLELDARLTQLRAVPLARMDDGELIQHTTAVLDYLSDAVRIHFALHIAMAFPLYDLASVSEELLGWDDNRIWNLLAGSSFKSTEPARRLAELARAAAASPAVERIIRDGTQVGVLDRIAEADPAFATAVNRYIEAYGHRTFTYEVADGTFAEAPHLFIGLIAAQFERNFDPGAADARLEAGRQEALHEVRETLSSKPAADRQRWEQALERAARAYPVREDNSFYTIGAPLALLRYAALEIGHRLARRAQIAHAADCFFLSIDECRRALVDTDALVWLVEQRKAEASWIHAHPGPGSYGAEPPPPPSLDALPPEARQANEALQWYTRQILDTARQADRSASTIRGIPASPGHSTGPVRIILDEHDFGKLQAGDVLVCPSTSPVWSVLFPSIAGLVTDAGGALSHPAIIAREYGVPAVVATGDATHRLHDGQMVVVDGRTGLVAPR